MESVERYNIEAVNNNGDLSTEGHKSSDGDWVKYEDYAAALTAERTLTETANAAAVNAYAKVRELEALLDGAKAAVELQRAKFAAFADENGEPRKVLGTLPVTADGCIIGDDCSVWYEGRTVNVEPFHASPVEGSGWHPMLCRKAWSTKQAAEAAKEKQ